MTRGQGPVRVDPSGQRWIGPYRLVRELGRGGMGVVFEAQRPGVDRRLALKTMLGQGGQAEERFLREAQVMARISHPNVCRVHELGGEPGARFIVTDLVEGDDLGTLADQARPGVIPHRRSAELIAALARGVQAAHAQGVLHRDLKPQNVIVTPDGSPVLLDFGLARDAGADRLTQTGVVMGTPLYMSPEQADGRSSRDLTAATDVYGLGALLLHLLAGRPPFVGGESGVGLLRLIIDGPPRWPSLDRRDTPPELEAVVRQAMAHDPALRYRTAEAMAEDLDRWLAGERPVAAEVYAPRRSVPGPVLAGVVTLLALAGAGAFAATRGGTPPPPATGPATVAPPPAAKATEPSTERRGPPPLAPDAAPVPWGQPLRLDGTDDDPLVRTALVGPSELVAWTNGGKAWRIRVAADLTLVPGTPLETPRASRYPDADNPFRIALLAPELVPAPGGRLLVGRSDGVQDLAAPEAPWAGVGNAGFLAWLGGDEVAAITGEEVVRFSRGASTAAPVFPGERIAPNSLLAREGLIAASGHELGPEGPGGSNPGVLLVRRRTGAPWKLTLKSAGGALETDGRWLLVGLSQGYLCAFDLRRDDPEPPLFFDGAVEPGSGLQHSDLLRSEMAAISPTILAHAEGIMGLATGPRGRIYSASGRPQTVMNKDNNRASHRPRGELRAWELRGDRPVAVGRSLEDERTYYTSLTYVPCGAGRDALLVAGTNRRSVVAWRVPGD